MPAASGAEAAVPAASETGLPYLSYRTTHNLSTLFTSAEHATESSQPASGHSYEALAQAVDGGTFGYMHTHTHTHTQIHTKYTQSHTITHAHMYTCKYVYVNMYV